MCRISYVSRVVYHKTTPCWNFMSLVPRSFNSERKVYNYSDHDGLANITHKDKCTDDETNSKSTSNIDFFGMHYTVMHLMLIAIISSNSFRNEFHRWSYLFVTIRLNCQQLQSKFRSNSNHCLLLSMMLILSIISHSAYKKFATFWLCWVIKSMRNMMQIFRITIYLLGLHVLCMLIFLYKGRDQLYKIDSERLFFPKTFHVANFIFFQ